MLSSIRKFSTSIYSKILLGIVVIPFVFWGMGSTFTGGNKNVLVKIDKEKLSTQNFADFITKNRGANVKVASNDIDELLSIFIGDKLMEKEYENFNIKLSDAALKKLIKNQKEFKRDNKFSRTEYEKFLLKNGMSAVAFESNLARQEKKKQLITFIGGGINPPEFVVEDVYNKINQKRFVEIIDLNDAMIKELNFSNEEISSYFEKNIDSYKQVYKSIKVLELNTERLIGSNEFNDIFFKKIDDINDLVISGESFDVIIDKYNLGEADLFNINKEGSDLNDKGTEKLSKTLIKNIYLIPEGENIGFFEDKEKFYIAEIDKTENVQKNLKDAAVVQDIKDNLTLIKKRKIFSEIMSKINQNSFSKQDFDKFSIDKDINIKKIKLNNINDNKKIRNEIINQIYKVQEKKIILVNDMELKEVFLIFIDKIEEASIGEKNDEYDKYVNLTKLRMTNNLFNTYDRYIKQKYKIEINYNALKTVKNFFN